MSLLKWILGGIAIAICVFTGYKLSEKYKLRHLFYSDFNSFNRIMLGEVSFTKSTLPEVLGNARYKGNFANLLEEYKKFLYDGVEFEYKSLWFLSEEEKVFITTYFKTLGRSDARSQLDYLKLCEDKLKIVTAKTETDEKKYRTLYLKMGLLTGLLVLVLII